MTGLQFTRVQKLTALLNLIYLIYVMVGQVADFAVLTAAWQKAAWVLFMLSVFLHGRFGLWTVVTDYIPAGFQFITLRIIDVYILCMLIWAVFIIC